MRIAKISTPAGEKKVVFDKCKQYKDHNELFLNGECVAILPHNQYVVLFEEYYEPTMSDETIRDIMSSHGTGSGEHHQRPDDREIIERGKWSWHKVIFDDDKVIDGKMCYHTDSKDLHIYTMLFDREKITNHHVREYLNDGWYVIEWTGSSNAEAVKLNKEYFFAKTP